MVLNRPFNVLYGLKMLNNQYSAKKSNKSLISKTNGSSNVFEFNKSVNHSTKANPLKSQNQNKPTPSELLERTIKKIDGAYADSTIRAYYADMRDLIYFCEKRGTVGLPIAGEDLCIYIAHLTQSGRTSASIRRVMAGVATIHKLNRFEDPTKDPDVLLEMRRMHRKLGRYSKQALGITSDILEKMIQASEAGNRGSRDRALLLLAYDSLCRRSELVELRIEDIQIILKNGKEQMSILMRKSKTDQYAVGKRIFVSQRTKLAIKEWLERLRNPKFGVLLRGVNRAQRIVEPLKPGQINRIYKRLARLAKLDEEMIEQISGHSLRVGHAQDMVNAGDSLPLIMSKGRWSKTDTVMRYVENINYN
jgi:site-specific recombinase XerD